jgi:predicted HTH domain antitoxin
MASSSRTVEVDVSLPWRRAEEPDARSLGRELRLLWLIEEVRRRRLGIGRAASLAELPRAMFMRVLGDHGVPVIDYDATELERELGALTLE